MKECDILGGAVKTYFDPHTYFQGSTPPTPRIYTGMESSRQLPRLEAASMQFF